MDLKHLMLSEVSQIEKDKYCKISLYVDSKKVKSVKNRVKWYLLGDKEWG